MKLIFLILSAAILQPDLPDFPVKTRQDVLKTFDPEFIQKILDLRGFQLNVIITAPEMKAFINCHNRAVKEDIYNYSLESLPEYNTVISQKGNIVRISLFRRKTGEMVWEIPKMADVQGYYCNYDLDTNQIIDFKEDR